MSEETPRLSRKELRERGLLKTVAVEGSPTPVELLSQTSEMRLRRPSRRELRMQRELNAAKEAEQTARFAGGHDSAGDSQAGDPEEVATEPEAESKPAASERSVAEKELKARAEAEATRKAEAEKKARAEAEAREKVEAEKKAKRETKTRKRRAAARVKKDAREESAKRQDAQAAAQETNETGKRSRRDSQAEASGRSSSGDPRRSVFDRFQAKADDREVAEGTLHERLVARTKEGQAEARANKPLIHARKFDFPSAPDAEADRNPNTETTEQSLEVPAAKQAGEEPKASKKAAAAAASLVETADHPVVDEDIPAVPAETQSVPAVGKEVAAGFPTDVTMRVESDADEEESHNSSLVFGLIILLSALVGVGLGLVMRHVLNSEEVGPIEFEIAGMMAQAVAAALL